MGSSTHHRDQTDGAALWLLMAAALIVTAAAVLLICYGALRLSQTLTHHTRSPWAVLGPTLLVLASAAAQIGDPLAHSWRAELLAALYAPCFGYGLYQAIAVYGPGLAHTATRLL